jgi:drug/metabolite transporter (DMT)-like permease
MIIALRVFFTVVLLSMLWVTSWASMKVALWDIPAEVGGHPWFIATLFDAYWGFLTFYCWVVYKERGWIARVLWLIGILLFGNIAMAIYALIQLFRVPTSAKIESVLLRRDHAG